MGVPGEGLNLDVTYVLIVLEPNGILVVVIGYIVRVEGRITLNAVNGGPIHIVVADLNFQGFDILVSVGSSLDNQTVD